MRVVALGLLLVAVGAGTAWASTRPDPEPVFCTGGMASFSYHGDLVALEDQGNPGTGGDCEDGPRTLHVGSVLGFDCRIRRPDGEVTGELLPNRSDGTCGQPDDGRRWIDHVDERGRLISTGP